MIQFLLNQELRQEDNLDPNTTVLSYLRNTLGKTGTKEGCASGDCGACSVVLAEVINGKLRYRSVNSCLTFVSALHGKQLITVEDLKHQQTLHSTQQAMADCHGSQCGFCTPGFVMSLFALQKNADSYDVAQTSEALAGNLCRCTGYRPIYDAAQQSCSNKPSDHFDAVEAQTIARLQAIAPQSGTQFAGKGHQAYLPTSTAELAELYLNHPDAHLLAGGTDLALEVTQFHRELGTLIYLGNVSDMQQIVETDSYIEIGSAAPLTDCYQVLAKHYPDFGELLHRFASLQIRNQGTLGGNIANASPIGDSPPLLIALDAHIQLRQGDKTRRIPLESYFLDYKKTAHQSSEFIEKIIIPKPNAAVFKAYKVSKRIDDDISAVCAAINIQVADGKVVDARLAFGGMAPTPKRASHCEQALVGQAWTQETIEQACSALVKDFTPLTDFRASKAYRQLVAQNLLRKYFVETTTASQDYLTTRVTAHV
ncbi:4-hydroxybenzoyl-CoA reductase subunit gamma [Marinomonas spartinae]|uniref:4-hydroxybenzoyl-CoA reductase subunit gamma n=1 Tax=Marinomonas spartinae TaxID=1792290 RepID=A0A1A8TD56_9GAMM|nr:xanthine dehydrogenase small subunit [Marinomonas spartinae]SBS30714.1 4-hydroxybenzoyl-CoA reductase subunit gamma [Marinomonas spartinae]